MEVNETTITKEPVLMRLTSVRLTEEQYQIIKDKGASIKHVVNLGILALDNNKQLIARINDLEREAAAQRRKSEFMQGYIYTLHNMNAKEIDEMKQANAKLEAERLQRKADNDNKQIPNI